jgi:hypothetical protein
MVGPPSAQESQQLDQLILAIEDLRRRVAALERASIPLASAPAGGLSDTGSTFESAALASVSPGLLPAVGRLLLGIAGAYLLRAIAEAGILPQLAGAALGLVYAAGWLLAPARIRGERRLAASFEAITASCIIAPLLWEATVRFHTLSAAASAAALSVFIVLGQAVAWRRDHSAIAAITSLAGCATAVALLVATLDPLPFTVALALAAAAVEYGAFRDQALTWRWVMALTLDFCAFLLIYLVTRPQGLPEGYRSMPQPTLAALFAGLAMLYLASAAARTLLRGLPAVGFELLQVPLIFTLAVAGILGISHGSRAAVLASGAACLILSAACYGAAFLRFQTSIARNFQAYATFGLLLALAGGVLLCSPVPLAALWSALAVAAVYLGDRRHCDTLGMHGAVYLLAAAQNSGLLQYSAQALTGVNRGLSFNAGALLCTGAAALCYGETLRFRKRKTRRWTEQAGPAILAGILSWSLAGILAGTLTRFPFDPSLGSTIHTALISALAIVLAWAGRRWNLPEMVWLLFPWMLFGAVKLLADDLQHGRSSTLFLSLLIYGGTLMALPRLLRKNKP